jgi:hypothetical protein
VITHSRLVAVIYVLLAAVSIVVIDLRLALIPTACASLLLFLGGVIVFYRWQSALTLPWPAVGNELEPESVVVIDGAPCPFQGYEQSLLVVVRTRSLLGLSAGVALAGAALYAMIFVPIRWEGPSGPRMDFFRSGADSHGWLGRTARLRWFGERRFLRRSRFTIGTILGKDPGFFRRGIAYQFFDHQGERRGGRGPLRRGSEEDNAVLVLYDPGDPDTNVSQAAFHFHRFSIGLLPGRRR